MQDAYDKVAMLEHQTLVAESTFQQMCLATDSIRAYAQTVRYELERASHKLYQYQSVTRNCRFAAAPRPPYAPGVIQPPDPCFLHTVIPGEAEAMFARGPFPIPVFAP